MQLVKPYKDSLVLPFPSYRLLQVQTFEEIFTQPLEKVKLAVRFVVAESRYPVRK
jgi:hypothetical protein